MLNKESVDKARKALDEVLSTRDAYATYSIRYLEQFIDEVEKYLDDQESQKKNQDIVTKTWQERMNKVTEE